MFRNQLQIHVVIRVIVARRATFWPFQVHQTSAKPCRTDALATITISGRGKPANRHCDTCTLQSAMTPALEVQGSPQTNTPANSAVSASVNLFLLQCVSAVSQRRKPHKVDTVVFRFSSLTCTCTHEARLSQSYGCNATAASVPCRACSSKLSCAPSTTGPLRTRCQRLCACTAVTSGYGS